MAYFRSHVLVSVDPECIDKDAYDLMNALQDELMRTAYALWAKAHPIR
ncbi:MAG: hypothetical protein SVT56_12760 [Chloroflexota bacterium]|jgi:hypothetical protein|nr:hypothetical protein [Chloroflexota bacterium]